MHLIFQEDYRLNLSTFDSQTILDNVILVSDNQDGTKIINFKVHSLVSYLFVVKKFKYKTFNKFLEQIAVLPKFGSYKTYCKQFFCGTKFKNSFYKSRFILILVIP